MNPTAKRLIATTLLAVAASAAHGVTDPQGDFLATYTGVQAADVDVLSAFGSYNAGSGTFTFGATLNGAIGTTANSMYVWGVNRGAGTERLNVSPIPLAPGVKFDAVINVTGAGSGTLNLFAGPAAALPGGAISITGNSLTVTLAASLLPSTGFAAGAYTWSFWPRVGSGSRDQISDFAPNAGALTVSAVPEPGALAMLVAGLAVVGAAARRRAAR
ncbi:MAG: PEP-CTERM sorting domain-containing protein [Burkholderiales bacterium]|nr:PEP-CTERM sorting domain-containing protein [Burkholderiales bacterium]